MQISGGWMRSIRWLAFTSWLAFLPWSATWSQEMSTRNEASRTTLSPTNSPPQLPGVPIHSPARRKVGFLAGAGLILLSLLILGTGLALVRAFKR